MKKVRIFKERCKIAIDKIDLRLIQILTKGAINTREMKEACMLRSRKDRLINLTSLTILN